MKIFNPAHFLRHISMPTLREFTDAHPLGQSLTLDWSQAQELLPTQVIEAVAQLGTTLSGSEMAQAERESIEYKLHLWHDDLRRAHLMSNELSILEFQASCAGDPEVQEAFASRDPREQSLWMLTFRDTAFRNAEMHIAFQAKSNGKYWKKHRIQAGLDLTQERERLEAFSIEVAKLYEKVGAGRSTHIERSLHASDGSVQFTIYVEGPITALAHFSENNFKRITTRIALETALVYQPATGVIESVVKGGSQNHQTVLQLFGTHVVGQDIKPEEIEKARFKLNELRDTLDTFDDLTPHGVEKIRLRRTQFKPRANPGRTIRFEASPEKDHGDAMEMARNMLNVRHSLEAEYNLNGASVLVYLNPVDGHKGKHFSFDVHSGGSSTIKNLSLKNQPIANAVLRSLNVIEAEEAVA